MSSLPGHSKNAKREGAKEFLADYQRRMLRLFCIGSFDGRMCASLAIPCDSLIELEKLLLVILKIVDSMRFLMFQDEENERERERERN